MALFVLNTGVRNEALVNLRWNWLVQIPELDTFVFLVPALYVKGRKGSKILILNSTAKSIVEAQRGRHEEYVFVWRRERVTVLDNHRRRSSGQLARRTIRLGSPRERAPALEISMSAISGTRSPCASAPPG